MSATIHSWSGRRFRHNEINVVELSTPGDTPSACYQIHGYWRTPARSQVENCCILGEGVNEALMPPFVIPTAIAAISIPC